ncbi:zf-HC2 domain-containing protein [Microlunatus capsulatus]|uniref:Anti-sigma-YlaC factor YlaD n=1 Tax=Microlunatus capsulatus TaxID=99117 RepID=A0ABS4ZAE2_9ACTN|nr:zf-HC2 domain-containing protein [Microlunatus capsulatus]MBP2418021.1 putative anti-sigma-YlaC factor YlaD [Microlunatus capsulatus]
MTDHDELGRGPGDDAHTALRELLGAHVLGQLGPDDQARVDAHLAGCAGCRAEVAALAPVVAALQELDPTAADALDPPAGLEDEVLAAVGGRRRAGARRARLRRAGVGLVAAAGVAAAFAAGVWSAGPRDEPPVIAVDLRLDAPGLTADAGLVRHTWGTELKLEATGLAAGQSYAVTFVTDDGSQVSAGSFLGTGADAVRCSVNAAVPVDQTRQLRVTDAQGALVMDADLG